MKTFPLSVLILVSVLLTPVAFAAVGHGGHGSGGGAYSAPPVVTHIEDKAAIVAASKYVLMLATQKKRIQGELLDASWGNIPEADKNIHWKNDHYFIVAFARKDVAKTLYILLSEDGHFYDANFSGEFTLLKK